MAMVARQYPTSSSVDLEIYLCIQYISFWFREQQYKGFPDCFKKSVSTEKSYWKPDKRRLSYRETRSAVSSLARPYGAKLWKFKATLLRSGVATMMPCQFSQQTFMRLQSAQHLSTSTASKHEHVSEVAEHYMCPKWKRKLYTAAIKAAFKLPKFAWVGAYSLNDYVWYRSKLVSLSSSRNESQ